MPRIKRGVTTRQKHKRLLDQAKGYRGRRKNTIRVARQAVEKAGQYAYRDRKVKKRNFRALWIQRINAGVRAEGLTYSQFMHGLKLAGVDDPPDPVKLLRGRRLSNLSGGEKQRVSLACTMRPRTTRVRVFDEPFGMLDGRAIATLQEELEQDVTALTLILVPSGA